ncbi:TetR/AcrR family transcriptional regulator [Rhodococcus phenolicus]|uniref:TetR/AcrR family transcriptional regulator n=1 Tax=Rhodococcus phenolicus TaxID=263849 RepID=UPI001FE176AA|nr:TetR/AcrR family transcriptional regulator [Rhodococcus phenolicus]
MTTPGRRQMRRTPRQDRSREMVERIVDAGRTVLLEHGYEGASTNRIAATARISPGSLYQYFPNKDAIVAEVVDRWTTELHARISRVFVAALEGPTWSSSVRATVLELLDALGENPRLLRVMLEQIPRTAGNRLSEFEERIGTLFAVWLRSNRAHRSGRPLDTIAWMLVRTVENVAIAYVLEEPDIDREVIADELTAMVTTYVQTVIQRRFDGTEETPGMFHPPGARVLAPDITFDRGEYS